MLWFYVREGESLRLATRYDNERLEYVGILTYPDGRQEAQRAPTARAFREWLVSLDRILMADAWVQNGGPQVLLDGWPDKTPPR
jgi:hypothetical protein